MLKNAYSKSSRTFDVIQKCLATHKAQKLMFDYDGQGRVIALSFAMDLQGRIVGFKLPARVEQVELALYRTNRLDEGRREQAYRTAWANLRDWITAQMALVDTGMVKVEEVFLPYMTARNGKTFYETLSEQRFMLPGGDQK